MITWWEPRRWWCLEFIRAKGLVCRSWTVENHPLSYQETRHVDEPSGWTTLRSKALRRQAERRWREMNDDPIQFAPSHSPGTVPSHAPESHESRHVDDGCTRFRRRRNIPPTASVQRTIPIYTHPLGQSMNDSSFPSCTEYAMHRARLGNGVRWKLGLVVTRSGFIRRQAGEQVPRETRLG